MKSRSRSDRIGRVVAPLPRFWCSLAALPAFLLIGDLLLRGIILALFGMLAILAGKKIRWGYFAFLILSITFFHLLAPWGRVLLEIGPLTISSGALKSGLVRGFGLVGMVFLSVAAVRPELELPGRLGGLLGRTFYHFDAVVEGKANLRRTDFFNSLDELLMDRFDPRKPDFGVSVARVTGRDSASGIASGLQGVGWAVVFAMVPWLLWILKIFELI